MPNHNACLADGMCNCTRQPCPCCGPLQPVLPAADGSEQLPQLTSSVCTATLEDNIVAAETDPKAREAYLYKLDSLVLGRPFAKVEISQDEVALLEAEARRALDEGYSCNFCRNLVSREDIEKSDGTDDGAHVFVVLTPKIVPHWSPQISYPRLEFAQEDKQVQRPPYVSAFPAALAFADLEMPTSLRFRVAALPSSKTVFSVGVAKWPGFKLYFGKGFGEEDGSWGLQWRAEDGAPNNPSACRLRLSRGDLVCVTCDTWRGSSTISVNGREAGNFSVPCGETFVLGATLSTGSVLRIESK